MNGNATDTPAAPTPPEKDRRWLEYAPLIARLLLAAVFLMAAITKLTDLTRFEQQVILHADLPDSLQTMVIFLLPWLELVLGVCLLFGIWQRETALLTAGLLTAFLWQALRSFGEKDCGCFLLPQWQLSEAPGWQATRNGLLLALAGLVFWKGKRT